MNIIVNHISEGIINQIRLIAQKKKISINGEILALLERGVRKETGLPVTNGKEIPKEDQVKIWNKLSDEWDDERSTKEIIDDIYCNRTIGRELEL